MTEFTDGLEIEGKGEKRLRPVDVDVLDNLINAQAAFVEAWTNAMEHIGSGAGVSDTVLDEFMKALALPMGIALSAIAVARA